MTILQRQAEIIMIETIAPSVLGECFVFTSYQLNQSVEF